MIVAVLIRRASQCALRDPPGKLAAGHEEFVKNQCEVITPSHVLKFRYDE